MDKTKQPGISCENIILVKSNFTRIAKFDLQDNKNTIDFKIDIKILDSNKKSIVTLNSKVENRRSTGESQASLELEFVGAFTVMAGAENMNIELFSRNAAPAIILPYIRYNIQDIYMKAGLPVALLPPLNLQALVSEAGK